MTISVDQIEDKPKVLSDSGAPTTGPGKGAFFPKDVGGRIEGHYVDNLGNEIQLTELGAVKAFGETNTASNVGAGQGNVFSQKTGVDLEFKTLLAGTGISIIDNADTIEITASGASGEANTASNVGAGNQIFKQKTGVDLQFRTLVAGSGIAISAGTDEITITNLGSSGEANTASNTGAGSQVFKQKTGLDLEFRTLIAGTNISLTQNADTIEISASGGGAGEANTASNLGAGEGLFTSKSGVDLPFKSLVAGTNVSLVADANTVTINASGAAGETNTGSNLGTASDANVFAQKNGVDFEFRRLTAGANVTITENANDIVIASTGGGGSSPTITIALGSGGTVAAKVAAATNVPAGYTLCDGLGDDGVGGPGTVTVDGQLSGNADDLVIVHNAGKVAVGGSVTSVDTLFGGWLNRPYGAGDLKTESNTQNQTSIKAFGTLAGTGAAVVSFDLATL